MATTKRPVGDELSESTVPVPGEEDDDESIPEYSSHAAQIRESLPSKERIEALESCLLKAYGNAIVYQEVPFIQFGEFTAAELADAFSKYPIIIKPTLLCINVAQRAIKRDLGIDFDTYSPRISADNAKLIAGYIKPLLPQSIAIPALLELDRYSWTDKEMRAKTGNWERTVTEAINLVSTKKFRKRKFTYDGEIFEIDAAHPGDGEIEIAIDVKRIEATRDTHKRADEIINKAMKFKRAHPLGKFFAVVYYPFPAQHINLKSRLKSEHIDEVFFAAETPSSIANTIELLIDLVGMRKI